MDQVKNKIQGFRKSKKINQSEIAKHLGISQAAYAKIESGKTKISLDKLLLIGDFLGVYIGDLLGDSPITNISLSHKNETKDLRDEIVFLEEKIKDKELIISSLKNEKTLFGSYLASELVSSFNLIIHLNKKIAELSVTEYEKEKYMTFAKNQISVFWNLAEHYKSLGFLSDNDVKKALSRLTDEKNPFSSKNMTFEDNLSNKS